MAGALHQQIADDLRAQIDSGQLATGLRLKSQRELAAEYTAALSRPVSRNVVRAATAVLVDAGLVEIRQGKGTFAIAPAPLAQPSGSTAKEATGEIPAKETWRARIWPWNWRGDTALIFGMAGQQPYVWLSFFSSQRSTFRGSETIILAIIIIATAIFLVTTIGDTVPGTVICLLYAFSTLMYFFSVLYWAYGAPPNFPITLTRLDAIYFSVGTLTTAGTGTISATSELTRGLQTVQMVLDFALVVFVIAIVMPRFIRLVERSAKPDHGKPAPPPALSTRKAPVSQ